MAETTEVKNITRETLQQHFIHFCPEPHNAPDRPFGPKNLVDADLCRLHVLPDHVDAVRETLLTFDGTVPRGGWERHLNEELHKYGCGTIGPSWQLQPLDSAVVTLKSYDEDRPELSTVFSAATQNIKDCENVAEIARKLEEDDEAGWTHFWRSHAFKVVSSEVSKQPGFSDVLDNWSLHENYMWTEFQEMRSLKPGVAARTQPKPDLTYAFPILKIDKTNLDGLKRDPLVQTFSLPVLAALNKGGVSCAPKLGLRNWSKYPTTTPLSSSDLSCFPWAIVELKKTSYKVADRCYCQAANAAAMAIDLQEQLFLRAFDDSFREVPPIITFTCVGPVVKVWLMYGTRPQLFTPPQRHMVCIWSTSVELTWGVVALRRIILNMHVWAGRLLKPKIQGSILLLLHKEPSGTASRILSTAHTPLKAQQLRTPVAILRNPHTPATRIPLLRSPSTGGLFSQRVIDSTGLHRDTSPQATPEPPLPGSLFGDVALDATAQSPDDQATSTTPTSRIPRPRLGRSSLSGSALGSPVGNRLQIDIPRVNEQGHSASKPPSRGPILPTGQTARRAVGVDDIIKSFASSSLDDSEDRRQSTDFHTARGSDSPGRVDPLRERTNRNRYNGLFGGARTNTFMSTATTDCSDYDDHRSRSTAADPSYVPSGTSSEFSSEDDLGEIDIEHETEVEAEHESKDEDSTGDASESDEGSYGNDSPTSRLTSGYKRWLSQMELFNGRVLASVAYLRTMFLSFRPQRRKLMILDVLEDGNMVGDRYLVNREFVVDDLVDILNEYLPKSIHISSDNVLDQFPKEKVRRALATMQRRNADVDVEWNCLRLALSMRSASACSTILLKESFYFTPIERLNLKRNASLIQQRRGS